MTNGIIISQEVNFKTISDIELDSKTGYGILISSGTNINRWKSLGIDQNIFIQNTLDNQPELISYAQGKVVYFDGNDSLIYNGTVNNLSYLNGGQDSEVVCVFKPTDLTVEATLLHTAVSLGDHGIRARIATTGELIVEIFAAEAALLYSMTTTASAISVNSWNWCRWYVDIENDVGFLVVNGTTYGPFAKTANTASNECSVAATIATNYVGFIGNLQTWKRQLTTGQRYYIDQFLSSEYDFAV